jgi:mannose-6-phosphate isomerase-like protein (cupin superfamily)
MKIVRGKDFEFVPASHEDPKDPGTYKKVLFGREEFIDGHAQMLNWARMPVGKSFNLHYHETLVEVFVMLKGKADITVGGETEAIGPGDAVMIDIGQKHSMKNTGDEDVEYIVFGISTGADGKTVNI